MRLICTALLLLSATVNAADLPQSKDHPLLGRVGGTEIVAYDSKRFDTVSFQTSTFKEYNLESRQRVFQQPPTTLEGARTTIWYEGAGLSGLEIVRQYQAELGGKGFTVVYDSTRDPNAGRYTNFLAPFSENEPRNNRSEYVLYAGQESTVKSVTLKRSGEEGETWVSIITVDWAQPDATYKAVQGAYAAIDVIDVAGMKKDIQFVSASDMEKSLDASGKVALYGIYFDTNQATLKPESKATLDEIAKLLQQAPELKVHVVGHTDNQGGLDFNMGLSKRRADAVRAALTSQYGIDGARLTANGVSYLAPVASNTEEAGRAKNRRVELVPF
ncbi:MAG: OmpA family protein [Lysobacterales bacterium]